MNPDTANVAMAPNVDGSVPDDNQKALLKAADDGNIAAVESLLEQEVPVDPVDEELSTPLILASASGHIDIVKLLLDRDAQIDASNQWGNTSLQLAAAKGFNSIVSLLLDRGAQIESQSNVGNNALQLAAANGHEKIVAKLLSRGAEVDSCSNSGNTALQLASANGHANIVLKLLKKGAAIDSQNEDQNTSLQLAAASGQDKVVEILLKKGAAINSCDKKRRTSLNFASSNGHASTVSVLLEHGAEIDSRNINEATPLLLAGESGHENVVTLLLNAGAQVDAANIGGNTPLQKAAIQGNLNIVLALLKNGAAVDRRSYSGNTPLQLAADHGHDNIVQTLLDEGAAIDSRNETGNTPLQLAASSGHEIVVFTLLTRKAAVDTCNNNGNTALQLACSNGHHETIRILLTHGAAVDTCNYEGYTPLHFTAEQHNPEIVALLLSHQAGHNRVDKKGRTPLHSACGSGHRDIAEMLLKKGADPNAENYRRLTPLHFASKRTGGDKWAGQTAGLIELLLAQGAKINGVFGDSPLNVACGAVNASAIECLVRHGADVHQYNSDGKTPFLLALEATDLQAFRPILFEKPGVLRTNGEGWSALHDACFKGDLKKVQALLEDSQLDLSITDSMGRTSLGLAVAQNHKEVALFLLGSERYYPGSSVGGYTYLASKEEFPKIEKGLMGYVNRDTPQEVELSSIVYWMIANGSECFFKECPSPNHYTSIKYRGGMTPLHIAAQYGNQGLIESEFSGQDPCQMADDKTTALHASAATGNLETSKSLLKILISSGHSGYSHPEKVVDLIMQPSIHGDTPFFLAVKGRHSALRNHFRGELDRHVLLRDHLVETMSKREKQALELAFRFEKPGTQDRLVLLLKTWFGMPDSALCDEVGLGAESWQILPYVVYHGQAIALWWLLSNGWVFDKRETDLAGRILGARQIANGTIISELLQNPPQIIEQAAITDSDRLPGFPRKQPDLPLQDFEATIIDFYAKEDLIDLHLIQRSPADIIYNQDLGPQVVMKESLAKSHRNLASLKRDLHEEYDEAVEISTNSSVPAYLSRIDNEPDLGALQFRWLHLPFNHVDIMDDLCQILSREAGRTQKSHHSLAAFFRKSGISIVAGAGKFFMKPNCMQRTLELGDTSSTMAPGSFNQDRVSIHMPYLTNATTRQNTEEPKTNTDSPKVTIFKTNLPSESKFTLQDPMTLDQFYYSSLENSTSRDTDQVVMRWVENLNHQIQQHHKEDAEAQKRKREETEKYLSEPGKTILAVDQIWIRVLDDKTIVSSCTNPEYSSEAGIPEQIRRFIMFNEGKGDFERPKTTKSMVEIILSITTGLFMSHKFVQKAKENGEESKSKNALEIFQESVRSLMDKEAILYRSFQESLEEESRHKHESKTLIEVMEQDQQNPYHVIDDEVHLLREVKDIRDELNMLKTLFEGQEQVWQQTFKTEDLDTFPGFQYNHPTNPTRVLREIQRVEEEAAAVQDSINALLDLRLQQAGLKEAEYGRWQADSTAKQANASLVFTVVAVLFLPLSFLTSLFALNVSEFPHPNGGDLEFQGKWVFPIIFCTSACVSVPFLIFAFNVNRAVDIWKWMTFRRMASSKKSSGNPADSQRELLARVQHQVEKRNDSSHSSSSRTVSYQPGDRARRLEVHNRHDLKR